MKKTQAIFRLADRLEIKYAQSQTLQQIIGNAASYGESSVNGIMNFPAQLKKDQADLGINVTVTSGTFGGPSVEVSQPTVEPAEVAANYAKLPEQIKKYLERHITSFPQVPMGTTTINYSGRTPGEGIAQN